MKTAQQNSGSISSMGSDCDVILSEQVFMESVSSSYMMNMFKHMMQSMHCTMICCLACQYQYLTRVSINICVTKVREAEKNFQ